MAKLFKISTYLVDANNDFNDASELETYLDNQMRYGFLGPAHIEEADLGEWDDNLPINYINCPESEFEKYFQEEQ